MSRWNQQLVDVICEYEEITARAQKLGARLSDAAFVRPPAPTRWSPAECITHLTLTNAAYLPLVRKGIEEAKQYHPFEGRYRRDLTGFLLSRSLEPSSKMKGKTPTRFEPVHVKPRTEIIREYVVSQREMATLVWDSTGLDIGHVKIASPFRPVKYNLYSAYRVLAAHGRRHVTQAEAAAR